MLYSKWLKFLKRSLNFIEKPSRILKEPKLEKEKKIFDEEELESKRKKNLREQS